MALSPERLERIRRFFAIQAAIITGDHFRYTPVDGKWFHGSAYINKDAIYPNVEVLRELMHELAVELSEYDPQVVVVPRGGAIAMATLFALDPKFSKKGGLYAVYADPKEEDFILKRGYETIVRGKRCIVLDDILKTGRSLRNTVRAVVACDGNVVATGALANRGKVSATDVEAPFLVSLLELELEKFPEETCPLCAADVPMNQLLGHGASFVREAQ